MRFVIALCALILSAGVAWAAEQADPVGHYSVKGQNPSKAMYNGHVSVTKKGETYDVVWKIGGETITGVGISVENNFSVAYQSGKDVGLAVYQKNPDGTWLGLWTIEGAGRVGLEQWQVAK